MTTVYCRATEMVNAAARDIRRNYFFCALMFWNTLVIFVLLNLGLLAVIRIRDFLYPNDIPDSQTTVSLKNGQLFNSDGSPVNNGKRSPYELDWFDVAAYENVSVDYVGQVLTDWYELSKLGYIYQPWVQFSEPPFTGQRVNVDLDPRGFPIRRTINPPNDRQLPVVEIFALGGSTTFGYNVSDEHTWPSYLAKILNEEAEAEGLGIHIEVSNYGRAYYNPSQETAFITELLKSGHRPSLVLFMDGVNPTLSPDVPEFTAQFSQRMRDMQFRREPSLIQALEWLPIVRLANFIKHRWFEINSDNGQATKRPADPRGIDYTVNAFEQDRQMSSAIADLYGIETLFFLQPNAFYKQLGKSNAVF